jgi:uncharacterized circularly permuted ATP-grasp superfamily protein
MSKLKIEHGASKVRWALLKTNIEEPLANDIDLMCKWSENDRKYVVNELLQFAITQAEDFQKYKAELGASPSGTNVEARTMALKPASNTQLRPDLPPKSSAQRE